MSNIIRPVRWWDMVSPHGEREMIPFLRTYMGKGKQFRTPKRMWEDLWRLKRSDMNHVMGMRKFSSIKNFAGPKYQKGMLNPIGFWHDPAGGGETEPDLSDFFHTHTTLAASASRIHLAYDSDGTIVWDTATTVGTVVYAQLTTDSDDTNNHTSEWWPDSPETNEGLNWDIRYTNPTNAAFTFHFRDPSTPTPADRVVDTWYVLDDVSNDYADGTTGGALITRITAKNSGTVNSTTDVEIRATTSGSAVASHEVDFTVISTGI